MSHADHVGGPEPGRQIPLHIKILVGLLIGAAFGLGANFYDESHPPPDTEHPTAFHTSLHFFADNFTDPVGQVFLRLMFMVVLPLVFSALSLGVAELGDVRRLGWVGLRTFGFTAVLSTSAVVLGIGLVNMVQPGKALPVEKREQLKARYAERAGTAMSQAAAVHDQGTAAIVRQTFLNTIPENPLKEMVGAFDGTAKGGMLAVMFFSLMFGLAITKEPERCRTLIAWLEGLNSVAMTIIGFAMRMAPLAVGCLVFGITSRMGLSILPPLLGFASVVILGLAIQLVVVYSLVLWAFGSVPPLAFFRGVSEAMLTAFGTSSSSATLPTAMRVAQNNLHLERDVANFVLTIGATGNQNGTALYEGVVVLFLAQAFGVELTLAQQVVVVMMSVLAGIGTAGVPGGSLPLIVGVLNSVGVPGEGIGIILGIDRFLDMSRTVLNVTGDLTIAACVAKREAPVPPAQPQPSQSSEGVATDQPV